ncbi:hypothetical protein ACFWAY_50135 [Rhodococcus sp. NPDC059968]|uniref:hypothetical protein n=1 Tax=Rhodococcus sp. NPDC059968 TaxID=3347017 RepID=UPI0036711D2B
MPEQTSISAVPLAGAPDSWIEHGEWGSRALDILGDPIPDRALAEQFASEKQLPLEDRRALLIRSRDLPDWRRPPKPDENPTATDDHQVTIYQRDGSTSVSETSASTTEGILFGIEALEPDPGGHVRLAAEVMNFSYRIHSGQPHRLRLLAYTEPGGTLLTNTAHFGSFPDDPETLWLAGGISGGGRRDPAMATWGEYFLSSRPTSATLTVILSYPSSTSHRAGS